MIEKIRIRRIRSKEEEEINGNLGGSGKSLKRELFLYIEFWRILKFWGFKREKDIRREGWECACVWEREVERAFLVAFCGWVGGGLGEIYSSLSFIGLDIVLADWDAVNLCWGCYWNFEWGWYCYWFCGGCVGEVPMGVWHVFLVLSNVRGFSRFNYFGPMTWGPLTSWICFFFF